MCRTDIRPAVHVALADLLDTIAAKLAEQADVPRDQVYIGPVDFGPENGEQGDA